MASAEMRLGSAVLIALLCLSARDAAAFCLAKTCDPKTDRTCRVDKDTGCVLDGATLHWESRCLSFGVQRDGSPKSHISYETADTIIENAFKQWLSAPCGNGKHPSFEIWDLGKPYGGIICDKPEFNSTKPNANVWMFRDDTWPYPHSDETLALTSTIFEKSTGSLLDADVEINSSVNPITTTTVSSDVLRDLESIVTHEAGHFLGMGHTLVKEATMYAMYSPGDLNYRSLADDDKQGICALYPPDRDAPVCTEPSPAHGFSLYCGGGQDDGTASVSGCSCSVPGRETASSVAGLAVAAAAVTALRRRRRLRAARCR